MTQNRPSRESKTEAMIAALLESRTLTEAAEKLGCHRRTLMRHLRHKAFQERYAAVKAQLLNHATSRLKTQASEAVGVLSDVAGNPRNPPSARVSAARGLLEIALRAHESEDLERRINELEKTLQGDKDAVTHLR